MFTPMISVLKEGQKGSAVLSVVEVNGFLSAMSSLKGQYCPEGKYMALRVNKVLMMSDTNFEQNSNYEVVRKSQGSVLIAGLGLGMIVLPIAKKPEVTEILVIEKYQDVIDLVLPQLLKALGPDAHKLKVICADILKWAPPKGETWDVIYFDIWPDLCTDNLTEMATLHRRFSRRKKVWMGSWARKLLQAQARQDARQRYHWR